LAPIFNSVTHQAPKPAAQPVPRATEHSNGTPTAATAQPAEQEHPMQAQSRRVIKRKGSGFTPSIKDALAGKFQEEKVEENAIEKMKYYTGEQLHEPFTAEAFAQKWNEYLQRLDDRPSLKSTMSRIPQIEDSCKLKLQIDNNIMDSEISKIKPDLVSWLRKELRNTGIELFTEVVELDLSSNRPYSETEKLSEMMKKNPHVNLLKQTFNLDFSSH